MTGWERVAVLSLIVLTGFGDAASAQTRPDRMDVWDLDLNLKAEEIPDAFVDYACGTNGGPPSTPLKGFTEFGRCKPERSGLHEVYFRYDDELEYWARALGLEREIRRFRGTQVFDFPVVLSLLFDRQGLVKGIRMVTDPRDDVRDRAEFWTMANFVKQRFGATGWHCIDLPREDGETPVGSYLVKSRCEKAAEGKRLIVENHYYRKKGQAALNPHTNEPQPDYFESLTRSEIYALDVALPPS